MLLDAESWRTISNRLNIFEIYSNITAIILVLSFKKFHTCANIKKKIYHRHLRKKQTHLLHAQTQVRAKKYLLFYQKHGGSFISGGDMTLS